MAKPSKEDIRKKQKDLEKHLKKLVDDTGQQKIPALMTMVRGAIRSSWAISPAKLAYFEMGRVPDDDPKTLRKWKMQCEYCQRWYNTDVIEIDHVEGNHSFITPADFESYFNNILDIQFKDLQRICKYRCHRVKSHWEAQDLKSMQYAACDKVNLFLTKFTEAKDYTQWLTDNHIIPETSAAKRRKQGMRLLLDLSLEEEYIMDFFEACDHMMRLEAKSKKAKRFSLKQKDYDFLKVYNTLWTDYDVAEPKLKLTIIG